MKFLPLSLLAPLIWAPIAAAQNSAPVAVAPVAVAPAANRQIALTLTKNLPALVRDRRTVSLPTGRASLRFPEVPTGDALDADSLQLSLDGAVKVLRQDGAIAAAPGYGLANFVGKTVSLLRPQTGGGEKSLVGTLLSAASPVLLETPEGVLLNPTGVWVLPREGRENAAPGGAGGASWQVESSRAGDFAADLLYATPKLGWSARYAATLSPERNRLNFRGWLAFENGTGAAFPAVEMSLRDGNGTVFSGPRGANLGLGETQIAYVAADVPVAESLIFATPGGAPFSQSIGGAHPQRSMTLENSTQNGLGTYLPQGSLALWQSGADRALRLDKVASWGNFSPADIISVPLGVEPTIFIDRTIASSKLLNPVTREITVAWKITTGGAARALTILDNVPARFRLTGATLKPATVVNNQLRFETNVSASTPVEFRFTVEVPA